MNIEYAKNPKWIDEEHSKIDLTVKFEKFNTELPFTASADDIEEHGRVLFDLANSGEFGEIAEYVPPPPEPEITSPTPSSGEIPVEVL